MSRNIIGKVALKYGEDVVYDGVGFVEVSANDASSDTSNAQCIIAFFHDCLKLGFDVPFDSKNYNSYQGVNNINWRDYVDPDRPPNTSSYGYFSKIGSISKIGDNIVITMNNVVNDTDQATGISIRAADMPHVDFYAPKKVTLEVHKINNSDIAAINAMYAQANPDVTSPAITNPEDLYDLLTAFVQNTVMQLDSKGFATSKNDGNKISLYGNAVQYIRQSF